MMLNMLTRMRIMMVMMVTAAGRDTNDDQVQIMSMEDESEEVIAAIRMIRRAATIHTTQDYAAKMEAV